MADPIHDDDVHNPPSASSDEDFHNGPSTDPDDPTPVVNTSGLNFVNTQDIDLSQVPEYERPVAAQAELEKGKESGDVAHVGGPLNGPGGGPNHVSVDDPNSFTTADQAHELQHVIQNKNTSILDDLKNVYDPRHVSLAQTKPNADNGGSDESAYDYGGTEGLEKHFKSGKTIADLTSEQQASIPQNYMKEYTKAVKKGDTKAVDRLNQVYQPAIKQLRNMANPSKDKIDTTPDAPAGAPAELLGLAKPVKGMASNSTKSADISGKDPHSKALNSYKNPEDRPADESYQFNQQHAKSGSYTTKLSAKDEADFQKWVKTNKVPWQDSSKADYDMRGYYQEMKSGTAKQTKNAWDGKMHFPDTYKTPYSGTFSRESKYAKPTAPSWQGDKLVTSDGQVVVDETPKIGKDPHSKALNKAKKALGGS